MVEAILPMAEGKGLGDTCLGTKYTVDGLVACKDLDEIGKP